MPQGRFEVGWCSSSIPPNRGKWSWRAAVSPTAATSRILRGLLARMSAKATHSIALLRVDEDNAPKVGRAGLLRLLNEVGVSAVQFEEARDRLSVFARVKALGFRL